MRTTKRETRLVRVTKGEDKGGWVALAKRGDPMERENRRAGAYSERGSHRNAQALTRLDPVGLDDGPSTCRASSTLIRTTLLFSFYLSMSISLSLSLFLALSLCVFLTFPLYG